ncbi:MAG: hypothetical protein JW882_13015 [Deltaproteobacteria bacterium]|nr:hypothetical protein [Deltaproteobacteria bacterium]
MPPRSLTSMAHPFSRLKTDGFRHRLPRSGYNQETEHNINSMNRLREVYYGTKMDDKMSQYLCDPESRADGIDQKSLLFVVTTAKEARTARFGKQNGKLPIEFDILCSKRAYFLLYEH